MSNEDHSLKEAFDRFRKECFQFSIHLRTYNILFDNDVKTREVIEKSANLFFHEISHIYVDIIFLHAARLTDPQITGNYENLTAPNIYCRVCREGRLNTEIEDAFSRIMSYRNYVKEARNKIIAHADLGALMADSVLGEQPKSAAKDFLEALNIFCDAVGNACGSGPCDFRNMAGNGDALDLLKVLERGLAKPPSARPVK